MEQFTYQLDKIDEAAHFFIDHMGDNTVFAFRGSMGAGKTTLTKAICEQLGVDDPVNSPTFALVNEYRTATSELIYHFDFYRINKIDEVYDFGYEDYFYSGAVCLIEWPEKIEELLPSDAINIYITEQPDGSRLLQIGD